MKSYNFIQQQAQKHQLDIFGALHVDKHDNVPEGISTLILLGPLEPGFWDHVTSQPEFSDGNHNPMDRWSKRIIDLVADSTNSFAVYPFGGPPYHPFISWALKSGRCWQSPVLILVHNTAGLFVSFRGALCFSETLVFPQLPSQSPCDSCIEQPCKTACPVNAISRDTFNATICRTYISSEVGIDCLDRGCKVRRACPVSKNYGRCDEQSRLHQLAFIKGL